MEKTSKGVRITSRRMARAFGVLLLAAGLFFGVMLVLGRPSQTVVLPDGRSIVLVKYAFEDRAVGYVDPNRRGKSNLRRFRDLVPRFIRTKIRALDADFVLYPNFPGEPFLSAYFTGRSQSGEPWDRPVTRVVLVGDRAESYDPVVNSTVGGGQILAFPRRTKKLRLRLMDGSAFLAEFTIPNPTGRDEYPRWSASALPVLARTGVLEISLDRFIADQQARMTACAFTVRENGNLTNVWRPEGYEIADATGNHWSPYASKSWVATNSPAVVGLMLGALWADEDAWKLRVTFVQPTTRAEEQVEFLAKPEQVEDYRRIFQVFGAASANMDTE